MAVTSSRDRILPSTAPLVIGVVALVVAIAAVILVLVRSTAISNAPRTAAAVVDLVRTETGVLQPYDPLLRPAPAGTIHQVNLVARETEQTIAAGIKYPVWTFGDQAPGPALRVRQGDSVEFTLRNEGQAPHSIDFHAAQTPWDKNYRSVNPGESISFTWQADHAGAFMYHCGTAPALLHIANGMYGAVIVDPAEGLPPAKEFVFVQSEFYAKGSTDGKRNEADFSKMLADTPDFVAFNGIAGQYTQHPLQAQPGEPLRFWIVNAGPSQPSAFHVVGGIFDRVYPDGNPANELRGMQTVSIPPGGGAMVELTVPEEGLYPIVSHSFASATKGALAMLRVGNPPGAPESASH